MRLPRRERAFHLLEDVVGEGGTALLWLFSTSPSTYPGFHFVAVAMRGFGLRSRWREP